ncbi:hypothetical protein ACOSQ2_006784 [Xanthoceras sorbifolium]
MKPNENQITERLTSAVRYSNGNKGNDTTMKLNGGEGNETARDERVRIMCGEGERGRRRRRRRRPVARAEGSIAQPMSKALGFLPPSTARSNSNNFNFNFATETTNQNDPENQTAPLLLASLAYLPTPQVLCFAWFEMVDFEEDDDGRDGE